MTLNIAADPRLDPRLRSILELMPPTTLEDVADREELLAEANSPEAVAGREAFRSIQDLCDNEEVAPSAGLAVTTAQFVSEPDGNTINLQIIRPETDEPLACVYYIHGGGMATMSCFDGMYRGWGKLIAANGVAVVMVDFRNCVVASSAPEVAPFPAGLNDCVSGLRWAAAHADELGIDPARIVVAGESGGGNLTLATGPQAQARRRPRPDQGPLRALPLHRRAVAGTRLPLLRRERGHPAAPAQQPRRHGLRDRGVQRAQPAGLAVLRRRWTTSRGFPPTVISVNECDPLRDEGINFYRLLLAAGVPARCRQMMGTMHGTEIFSIACPDISRDTARDIAGFARDVAPLTRPTPGVGPLRSPAVTRPASLLDCPLAPSPPTLARLAVPPSCCVLVAAARVDRSRARTSRVVRAALAPGKINHILVIEFENEGYDATFGPGSPATYLNGTLRPKGELLQNYYAIGHNSLDNYIAQVSGQAPTEDTQADCADNGFAFANVTPGTPDPDQAAQPGPGRRRGLRLPGLGADHRLAARRQVPAQQDDARRRVARLRAGHGQHAVT